MHDVNFANVIFENHPVKCQLASRNCLFHFSLIYFAFSMGSLETFINDLVEKSNCPSRRYIDTANVCPRENIQKYFRHNVSFIYLILAVIHLAELQISTSKVSSVPLAWLFRAEINVIEMEPYFSHNSSQLLEGFLRYEIKHTISSVKYLCNEERRVKVVKYQFSSFLQEFFFYLFFQFGFRTFINLQHQKTEKLSSTRSIIYFVSKRDS